MSTKHFGGSVWLGKYVDQWKSPVKSSTLDGQSRDLCETIDYGARRDMKGRPHNRA